MGLKCMLGMHNWAGCKCFECDKTRDEGHYWREDCEKCRRCGQTRSDAHTWNGCTCAKCGKTRDEGHDWSISCEICFRCGMKSPGGNHQWSGCRCMKCGKIKDQDHHWVGCKCSKCDKTRDEGHDWSKNCEKCEKCGHARIDAHDWSQDCEQCSICGYARTGAHVIEDWKCVLCGRVWRFEDVVSDLEHSNSQIRLAALNILGTMKESRTTAVLFTALDNSESLVREAAASEIGKLGDRSAITPLIASLNDEDDNVCKAAAAALREIGTPAVEHLLEMLKNSDCDLRIIAANALGKIGDTHAVEPLVALLNDENKNVCRAAASALGGIGRPAVEYVIEKLKKSDECSLPNIAKILEEIGKPTVELLVKVLRESDENLRIVAVKTLAAIIKKCDMEMAIAFVRDRRGDAFATVLSTMGAFVDYQTVKTLEMAINDSNQEIRETAKSLLAKIESIEVKNRISYRATRDKHALFGSHDMDLFNAYIAEILEDEADWADNPNILAWSVVLGKRDWNQAEALGRASVDPLVSIIQNSKVYYRRERQAAAETLIKIGDDRAIKPLINSLTSYDFDVRWAAATALIGLYHSSKLNCKAKKRIWAVRDVMSKPHKAGGVQVGDYEDSWDNLGIGLNLEESKCSKTNDSDSEVEFEKMIPWPIQQD